MIKITCDICERDITSIASLADGKKCAYCITVYGKQLDMCKECRCALYDWVEKHKAKCKTSETEADE